MRRPRKKFFLPGSKYNNLIVFNYCIKGSLEFSRNIFVISFDTSALAAVSNSLISFDLFVKRIPFGPLKCLFIAAVTTGLDLLGAGPFTLEPSFHCMQSLPWRRETC